MVKMSDVTDKDIAKPISSSKCSDSTLIKTVRMTLNLLANIFMCMTVYVSLMYAFSGGKITVFQLHIVLCVLGYQFLMCQGTLLLSRYNSWSMYLDRRNRKRLHILFQVLGFLLVVVGSSIMMCKEERHFNSTHSSLGIIALIITTLSVANGLLATNAYKINQSQTFLIKFLHYGSGVLGLFVSAAALSTGFEEVPFRMWIKNEDAVTVLICITWIFTFVVSMEFLLLLGQRLRNIM